MDNQRTLLLVALFFTLFLIWQKWQEQYMPNQPAAVATTQQKGAGTEMPTPTPTPAPGSAPADDLSVPSLAGDAAARAESALKQRKDSARRIHVSTDVYDIEIDTFGGDVRILKLKKYPVSVDQPDQPTVLMSDIPPEWYVAQSGLIGRAGSYPNHKTVYTAKADHYEMDKDGELVVPLYWNDANGVQYIKEYVFTPDHYLIQVRYRINNQSGKNLAVYPYGQLVRKHVAKKRGMKTTNRSYTGAAIYTPSDKFQKLKYDEILEKPLTRKARSGWVAMLQHYFTSIWILPEGDWTLYTKALDDERYAVGFNANAPVNIAPGSQAELDMQLFAGPKDQKRMKRYGESLKLTVDYGFLTPISAPLFWLLSKIHGLVGNWGWAIIILTILIKMVFFPLSAASYKSMAKMKNLAPRMKTLKERYGDDKQKYQQAVMEFYRKEKINPMGGCLPILIQIPVFIALYWVLLESVELRQAPWAFWIKDLSSRDPYFILPIIMGVSMFVQQKLNPPQADPMQQKIMMALPVVFTFFFLYFPAGLVLYWVVNNILSIAQQWYINKSLGATK